MASGDGEIAEKTDQSAVWVVLSTRGSIGAPIKPNSSFTPQYLSPSRNYKGAVLAGALVFVGCSQAPSPPRTRQPTESGARIGLSMRAKKNMDLPLCVGVDLSTPGL